MGPGGCFREVQWLGHEAVHYHLVPRLRMSGAVPLLPPYSVMACTGTTFLLRLANRSEVESVKGCEEVNINCLGLCGKRQQSQFVNSNDLSEVLQHYK
jgi:hypothetical protein